ncbi:MAG TPA: SDR family NAD(P)-dependent oxidoreductase [Gaiellaceae bacterium]|nr:SDR family NAD(P)-dependent oxidoreductase [Gaiellaceae bacterium]
MPRLEGRHVVVTGAGRGIGKAIALRLASEGASLSLLARGLDALERTAEEVGGAFVAQVDIRDEAQVEAGFAAAAAANGPIHALVANSGIGGPNEAGAEDRFGDLVATNLVGTYLCVRAAQRRLAPGPERRDLVVIASILARIGVAGYTGYCASKAGLLGLVRSLAAELAPENVQVNAICPGWVETDMAWEGIDLLAGALGVSREDAFAEAMREVPLRRMSQPEDVAGTVAWLLSPDSRGVTGQTIDQNGGAVMP